jgi:hypothetical protein
MTTALEFNTLLRNADIDPADVQLMRHVPSEPSLKKIRLGWRRKSQNSITPIRAFIVKGWSSFC